MEYSQAFKKLATRYKELRLHRGMVQEDVLEYDFSVRHYQQLEAGRPHSLTTFFRLSAMFEIQPETLIQGLLNGRNGRHKKKNNHGMK